jgi:Flp pilus assembly protein protease CpaA
VDRFGHGSGTTTRQVGFRFAYILLNGFFVVCVCFALYESDGAGGANGKTVAEAVAVIVSQQLRFSVHHTDCAFMASVDTEATTVAFFLVDLDDFSDHYLNLQMLLSF